MKNSTLTSKLRKVVSFAAITTVMTFGSFAQAQSLTNIWRLLPSTVATPGDRTWLTTNNNQRGMTFNAPSNQVLVLSREGGNGVYVLNAADGTDVNTLKLTDSNNVAIISGGAFNFNMLGASDDGAIYACNLISANTTAFKVYRWENTDPTTSPTVAFSGDPGVGITARWGDQIAIRGSGVNTELLIGSDKNFISILKTIDGVNYTSQRIDVSSLAANNMKHGLSFYTNNTFWAKSSGFPLVLVNYSSISSTTAVGSVIASFTTTQFPPSGNNQISANPTSKQLASIDTSRVIRLYDISNLSSPPVFLAQTNFSTSFANGNTTGAQTFGGTNRVFSLYSNNGLIASAIDYPVAPVGPSIVSQPASQTVYETFAAATFSVSAIGSAPLRYVWQKDGANIVGATNSSLTISNVSSLDAGIYAVTVSNSVSSVTSSNATLTVKTFNNTAQMTNIWNLLPGSRNYLVTDNNQRGLAFNPATSNLFLVSRTTSSNIIVLDAATGAEKYFMNVDPTVITPTGGAITFNLNKIGVAADGKVYAANLVTSGNASSFRIYSWDNDSSNTPPVLAFLGDPGLTSNLRWGDSMVVRGSGATTEILLSAGSGNTVSIIKMSGDGVTLDQVPQVITVTDTGAPAPSAFAQLGLAFGPGNTFWGKNSGFALRNVTYDPVAGTGDVTHFYSFSVVPSAVTAIAVQTNLNFLAGLSIENPDTVLLYDISNLATGPVLRDQELFSVKNPNGNLTGQACFGGTRLFVLDSNNGIKAFNIDTNFVTTAASYSITAVSLQGGNTLQLTWTSEAGRVYQLQSKTLLTDPGWTNVGSTITATGTTTSTTVNISGGAATQFYRIQTP